MSISDRHERIGFWIGTSDVDVGKSGRQEVIQESEIDMPAVEVEVDLPADVYGSLDADRSAVGQSCTQIVDRQLLSLGVERSIDLRDGKVSDVNVIGGRGSVDLQLSKVIADAVDAQIGSDTTADALERRHEFTQPCNVDRISLDVGIEGEIGSLQFRIAAYGSAEGIGIEIRQVDGVIEVLEMRGDVRCVKSVVLDRRNLYICFDERTLDGASQLSGEGGNAVDGDGVEHGTRLKPIGLGMQVEVGRITVDANGSVDVGKLIVGGDRGIQFDLSIVEKDGAVDVIDDGLLDENSAVGNVGATVKLYIIAPASDTDICVFENAVEDLNTFGDFFNGEEGHVIPNVDMISGDVKRLTRSENGCVNNQIGIEGGALDMRFDIVGTVELDVGLHAAYVDRFALVSGDELVGSSLDVDVFGAVHFDHGIYVLNVEGAECLIETFRAEHAVDEFDIGIEI